MRLLKVWSAFVVGLLLCMASSNAQTPVQDVLFEGNETQLRFLVVADGVPSTDTVEKIADADPSVLMVRFAGLKAQRRWVKLENKHVKRALIHPSREKKNAAVLRIRFVDKRVTPEFIKKIHIVREDAGLRVEIPLKNVPQEKQANAASASQPLNLDALNSSDLLETTAPPRQQPEPMTAKSSPKKPSTSEAAATSEQATSTPPSSQAAITQRTDNSQKAPNSVAEEARGASAKATDASRNPLPVQPEQIEADGAPAATESNEDTPEAEESITNAKQAVPAGIVFMPGVRTRDIVAGFTDLTLRLEKGLRDTPGVRRLAVFPFLALDPIAERSGFAEVSRALMTERLVKRPKIITANQPLLEQTIDQLPKDPMGRYAIDEAKALGIVVGADTLLIGTIGSAGNGYIVDARAVDANTGERLASVSQEFEAEAFGVYADRVTNTTTVLGGAARSLAFPGWGQFYHGDAERGAMYGSLFVSGVLVGVASALIGQQAADKYQGSDDGGTVSSRDDANRSFAQANIMFTVSGMVWLASIADALITGENRREIDPKQYAEAVE